LVILCDNYYSIRKKVREVFEQVNFFLNTSGLKKRKLLRKLKKKKIVFFKKIYLGW
jgi:hypothetical protein